MKKQSLGDRMKGYEDVSRVYLTRRMPLIIRIDGKAFHSFTKGFHKPFDAVLMRTIQHTMVKLCEAIQGCKLGYTQSDEISLLLVDYDKLNTAAWFDKNLQKVVSLSASIATMEFNREFTNALTNNDFTDKADISTYNRVAGTAMFDSRAFVLPEAEVCNYFLWRQQDATRNAIEMTGQAHFSHKQLHKKNCNEIQEMLFQEKGINFNNLPTAQKRGSCAIKETYLKGETERNRWVADLEIPIFSQDRNYVEKWTTVKG